jgi:hypothetical protein
MQDERKSLGLKLCNLDYHGIEENRTYKISTKIASVHINRSVSSGEKHNLHLTTYNCIISLKKSGMYRVSPKK